jgi:Carboxypeptidase regulatory-like domain
VAVLHGVVRNAVGGEAIPRALVSVEGDAATGVLTDGDGKFQIPNLPVGPVILSIRKPGYIDSEAMGASIEGESVTSAAHNVMVAQDMPDVDFAMTPTGAIRGQVDLSTGEPAEGISLNLLRRVLVEGRAGWASAGGAKTRSDGSFRFGELDPGVYELYTEPSLDSDNLNLPVAAGRGGATHEWGFPTVYYPDARDPSSASTITVDAGATAQANLTLGREAFQTVTAAAILPQGSFGQNAGERNALIGGFSPERSYAVQVTDISGRALPYPARYDSNSKMIQASLPDGGYRLTVSSSGPQLISLNGSRVNITYNNNSLLQGSVDVQVAGQPVTNLRVPMTEVPETHVQLNLLRNGTGAQSPADVRLVVSATQAPSSPGQLPDEGMVSELATGSLPGPLEGQPVSAGAYWLHTIIGQRSYCESSFTAGGANLAREPLLVGPAGVPGPLELTLRDDCAKLSLSLPETLETMQPGEEKFYTVYAVPDFDSTVDPQPVTLRPSTGATMTLEGLTPGNYHVYALEGNAELEYRNPASLARMQGQAVTLSPGATSDLVVDVPGTQGAGSSE